MATRAAPLDRKPGTATTGRASRPRRPAATKPPRRPAATVPAGLWPRAAKAGLAATALALAAAVAVSLLAGHAPSWRSLKVVCLQALPLLPGIALLWWGLERLRARFAAVPLAFWLGLAFLGTLAVMLVVPGLVFAVHSRTMAFAEDHDGEIPLLHHLLGAGGALYLYATTAFRLWWPWGASIPLLVTALFWRSARRRG
jgi:hypothetical protein